MIGKDDNKWNLGSRINKDKISESATQNIFVYPSAT
jgi:hypothetical protein